MMRNCLCFEKNSNKLVQAVKEDLLENYLARMSQHRKQFLKEIKIFDFLLKNEGIRNAAVEPIFTGD